MRLYDIAEYSPQRCSMLLETNQNCNGVTSPIAAFPLRPYQLPYLDLKASIDSTFTKRQ
jgi:hypothetical protein